MVKLIIAGSRSIDDEYNAYMEKWEKEHKDDKPDQF